MSDNRSISKTKECAEYNSLVAYINFIYCKEKGYDFIYYQPYLNDDKKIELYNCIDYNTGNCRHAAWSKLLSSQKALKEHYEYIVYIDSDCIFYNIEQRIEMFIDKSKQNDMVFFNNAPWNYDLPCSGFYIIKNTQKSKEILYEWYNHKISDENLKEWIYSWNIGELWEQDTFWLIYNKYPTINVIMNQIMFEESNGQFLRHVCHSVPYHQRKAYFRNIVDVKEKHFGTYESVIKNIKTIKFDTYPQCSS